MTAERHRLVEQIRMAVRATTRELGFDRLDPQVEPALRTVPRERFVPDTGAMVP
ncbi:hypothetical protein [Allochromatium vinosum]|uniref:Uncharacterized protein n=1 Tax=Allochromatium vinosum (strain ATCC 17899 / DSM 180 / NBRC 103801 / NCIMB 10441 / D) TaxID=572477 RepID=D3RRX6_ALLVD|nr:hypothetical protein [Allochromatium vinosum]ADC62030.1 hypothetical protein Alvin_1091 [Allochromatium vinosum DSM 180]